MISTTTRTTSAAGGSSAVGAGRPAARPYGQSAGRKLGSIETFPVSEGFLHPSLGVAVNEPYSVLYKVLCIGDSGVGKSSLLRRLTNPDEDLPESQISTIGVDFQTQMASLHREGCPGAFESCRASDAACVCQAKLQIWDTAGQERFRTIISSYYRGGEGFMIVFDVTQRATFESVRFWLEEVHRYCGAGKSVLLIGNKSDLANRREVSKQEAQEYADLHGFSYVETSAASNRNVSKAFLQLTQDMHRRTSAASAAASTGHGGFKPTLGNGEGVGAAGGLSKRILSSMSMFCNIL